MYELNKELLKYFIASRGLTYAKLAEVLEISTQSFRNRVAGRVPITLTEIYKIAELLKLTDQQILEVFFKSVEEQT